MSATRARRPRTAASVEADRQANTLVARYRPRSGNAGGALKIYGRALDEIEAHCKYFLELELAVNLGVFGGPRPKDGPSRDAGASSCVLADWNRAVVAVKALRATGKAARKHVKRGGNLRTQEAKEMLLELARIWETDTGQAASQKLNGPFGTFASSYLLKAGFHLTKTTLEAAMRNRQERSPKFRLPAAKKIGDS